MMKKNTPKKFELVKDANDDKGNYIMQKNTITKTGTYVIIGVLLLLVLAVIATSMYF